MPHPPSIFSKILFTDINGGYMLLAIPQEFSLGYFGGLLVEKGASVTCKRLENQRYPQHSRSIKMGSIVRRLVSDLSKA